MVWKQLPHQRRQGYVSANLWHRCYLVDPSLLSFLPSLSFFPSLRLHLLPSYLHFLPMSSVTRFVSIPYRLGFGGPEAVAVFFVVSLLLLSMTLGGVKFAATRLLFDGAQFGSFETREHAEGRYRALLAHLMELQPDVICLNEVTPTRAFAKRLAQVSHSSIFVWSSPCCRPVVVFSLCPIVGPWIFRHCPHRSFDFALWSDQYEPGY